MTALVKAKNLFPIIATLLCIAAEKLSQTIFPNLPTGSITTVADVSMLSLLLYRLGIPSPRQKTNALAYTAVSFYLIGDAAYGLLAYIFDIPAANTNTCLIYVLPYIFGMSALLFIGFSHRKILDRGQTRWVQALFLVCSTLSTIGIVVPALTQKSPPLALHLAVLTVIYTILESAVLSLSLVVASFANSPSIQTTGLAVSLIHASDLALRYQSLRPEFMAFGLFEFGWLLGISLLIIAHSMAKTENYPSQSLGLPVLVESKSIRGTLISLTFGLQAIIMGVVCYYLALKSERQWNEITSLMVTCLSISVLIAIPAARTFSDNINELTQSLNSQSILNVSPHEHELRKLQSAINTWNMDFQKQLSSSRAALDTFAHDLKSPIAAIQSASELLKSSQKVESENISLLEVAKTRIESLSLSALESRKRNESLEDIRISVRESIALASTGGNSKRIEVLGNEPTCPILIKEFGRVFSNILTNALEATPADNPIQVEWIRDENEVILSLTDQGGGIPIDILEAAKRGISRSSKKDGNGIGLKTCFEWSRQQGVHINVDNQATGTRFTWRFHS